LARLNIKIFSALSMEYFSYTFFHIAHWFEADAQVKEGLASGKLDKSFAAVPADDAIARTKAAIEAKTWTCEVVDDKAHALEAIKKFIPKVRFLVPTLRFYPADNTKISRTYCALCSRPIHPRCPPPGQLAFCYGTIR
jgi:hypothetical protein